MLWAAGHVDLPKQKPQQLKKQEVKTSAWKHCRCCKHLQLKALCCSHGTCSGRRYKPRWQPASRGRRRPRWWQRTLPKRRSPLSRPVFPGACLRKWEPQNSLDATWKTSHRAAGEVQKMKTVTLIKINIFALIPDAHWPLWITGSCGLCSSELLVHVRLLPCECQGEPEHMNTSFNQSQRKVYVPVVWYKPPCRLWGFAMATTEKG